MLRVAGEYFYLDDKSYKILNPVLTSLAVGAKVSPIAFRESSNVLPTFAAL